MVNLNPFAPPKEKQSNRYLHNLKKGDHVVRWTRLVVYPIQVHGIVLSASDDVVTIVDFGLTAHNIPNETEDPNKEQNQIQNQNQNTSNHNQNNMSLEEMVNDEDKAMMKTCEEHRYEIQGPDRINILVLAEEKDIKQWKKVEYHVEDTAKKNGKFKWWWGSSNSSTDKDDIDAKDNIDPSENNEKEEKNKCDKDDDDDDDEKMMTDETFEKDEEHKSYDQTENNEKEKRNKSDDDGDTNMKINNPTKCEDSHCGKECVENQVKNEEVIDSIHQEHEIETTQAQHSGEKTTETTEITETLHKTDESPSEEYKSLPTDDIYNTKYDEKALQVVVEKTDSFENEHTTENKEQIVPSNKNEPKEIPESLRTRADPTNLVIARVRYLVSHPDVLPPHNILWSNSGMLFDVQSPTQKEKKM